MPKKSAKDPEQAMSEVSDQEDQNDKGDESDNLPSSHVMVYPDDVKVLQQDHEEYLIPKGMSLVDERDQPIELPEFDALEVGKLILESKKIQFSVRFTKITFEIVGKQLQMLVNKELKYVCSYRMMYFTEMRKLYLGKHCIQIPVYCALPVYKKLKAMAKSLKIQWIENRVEFMDDQYNHVQFIEEQDNIIFNFNSRFITALAKLDYYPQKEALFTGQKWINMSNFLNSEGGQQKQAKIDQLVALFAIQDVYFNVKYLCGYPSCHGYGPEQERNVRCAASGCELMFHKECALFMDKNFNTEVIDCPLHYDQSYVKLGALPTFQEHANEYDRLNRSWPARPVRKNLDAAFKPCKLTRKQAARLSLPYYQKRQNCKCYGASDESFVIKDKPAKKEQLADKDAQN